MSECPACGRADAWCAADPCDPRISQERDKLAERVAELEDAIRIHQACVRDQPKFVHAAADRALWRSVPSLHAVPGRDRPRP